MKLLEVLAKGLGLSGRVEEEERLRGELDGGVLGRRRRVLLRERLQDAQLRLGFESRLRAISRRDKERLERSGRPPRKPKR